MNRYSSRKHRYSNRNNSKKQGHHCSKDKHQRHHYPLSSKLKKLCLLGRKLQEKLQFYRHLKMRKGAKRGTESRKLPM